ADRVGSQPPQWPRPPVHHRAPGIDDADEHLRAAEIDADRLAARDRPGVRRGPETGKRGGMREYDRVMAPGDPERPDRPEYKVYRAGSKGRSRGRPAEPHRSDPAAGAGGGAGARRAPA